MSLSDTTFIRDMSHYDSNLSLSGYAGTTHKITEGRTYVDPAYGARMNSLRTSGKPVLGSYHVLHTTDPAGQLQFWIAQQDRMTPWWRDWPHWIMQIDAERWPTDNVPASTVVTFAKMLHDANLPGLQICYASRGQYGNDLAGIPLDLWNAAYHSSTYPGNSAADWRPYSGRVPAFWQYTSTPFDKNAFRGTVAELLAYIEGGDMTTVDLTSGAVQAIVDALTKSTNFTDKLGGNRNPISEAVWDAQQIPNADGTKRIFAWQAMQAAVGDPVTAAELAGELATPLAAALAPLLPSGPVDEAALQAAVLGAFKAMATALP